MLRRISSVLGAVVLGGVLVASTYGAPAASSRGPAHPAPTHRATLTAHLAAHRPGQQHDHFVPPVLHRYRADGLRMGLHCETAGMSMP